MYYLSRVEIDTKNRRKISDLSHLGAYHNWVEQSFPLEVAAGERKRKLWRIDQLNDHRYLLVLSQSEPDLKSLEKYGIDGTGKCLKYDLLLDSLKENQKVSFRLMANPVRAVKGENRRGRIYPHVTVEQQMAYLESRAQGLGFSLEPEDYNIVQRDFPILRKKGGISVKLARAVYEGSLTIKDADIFRKTLTEGIGREKAYGFGMMTILPRG
ncbi:MAG TPA: type I-E CRISPR-associated protein Cas6/Cse3/CasE [Candidatus Merdenecus merdavium]|nr:type I-E CRISPR-associated protein Cas6/Cse3/CasE [Candidatus Merdenecus merdavium]